MNKKQQKKLEEVKIELDAYVLMSQLVLSMMGKAGKWQKSNQKWPHSDDVVYWDDLDGVGISVDDDGNFKAFNDIDFVCPITIPKFIELIRELAPKPKAKKNQQPKLKEFQITYNVWGNNSDCLLSGTGTIAAKSEDEVADLVLKDFTEKGVLCDFEITNSELLHEDDETPCWNVFYTVSGKHGSYDGVGCPYTNTVKQGEKLVKMDFLEGGLDPEEEFDVEVDGEAT